MRVLLGMISAKRTDETKRYFPTLPAANIYALTLDKEKDFSKVVYCNNLPRHSTRSRSPQVKMDGWSEEIFFIMTFRFD